MKEILVFRLMGEELGIDVFRVCEVLMPQEIFPLPKGPDFIEGVINIRGKIIVVIDLRKKFGMQEANDSPDSRIIICSIKPSEVGNDTGKCKNFIVGLIVDEVAEVLEVYEDMFDPAPGVLSMDIHTDYINGTVRLGERVVITLDLDKIFTHDDANKLMSVKEDKEEQ